MLKRCHQPRQGGFNICFVAELDVPGEEESVWALMRIPIPGMGIFPEEKLRAEAAIMAFVREHTTIPVPRVWHFSTAAENPTGLGPYLITDFIPDTKHLFDYLMAPKGTSKWQANIINSQMPEEELQGYYAQMADILLQLDRLPTMPLCGSLSQDWDGKFAVIGHPLPQNVVELVTGSGVPKVLIPPAGTTYKTSDDFYRYLANAHMAQLCFQHNDCVHGEDDARDKYIARHLFRRLARQNLLVKKEEGDGTPERFKLICDDLTPYNCLTRDGKIVAMVDWEFAYFGPASIASGPALYPRFLDIFLRGMEELERTKYNDKKEEEEEDALASQLERFDLDSTGINEAKGALSNGTDKEPQPFLQLPLSVRMRQNWENGRFWINWAARSSFAFDTIYWKYIDRPFFGEDNVEGGFEKRLCQLNRFGLEVMERVVNDKMKQRSNRKLKHWSSKWVQEYLEYVTGQIHL
ncbi:hypothetical protein QBC35DRAFT_555303 [Podospora australis]|uniref:Aminoglycoside phosphotransferase domain-containing protein n=1 Tax=Podospora australis TaxID=1536484 RepID=A0AAN6WR40_9PEZI|nr:hypothetical protein QBC35DRAFT_555303 [Podospora australis]